MDTATIEVRNKTMPVSDKEARLLLVLRSLDTGRLTIHVNNKVIQRVEPTPIIEM